MTNRALESSQHIWEQYVGMSHPLEWATDGQPDEAQIQRHVEWAAEQGYEIEAGELAEAMRTCIQADLEWQAQQ